MSETSVHDAINDTFMWLQKTLRDINPPMEYRY